MSNDMLMVRIYLSEADHGKRKTLMQEILTLLQYLWHAVQGVTVFRGIAGFGAGGEVRADDILRSTSISLWLSSSSMSPRSPKRPLACSTISFGKRTSFRGSLHDPGRRRRS